MTYRDLYPLTKLDIFQQFIEEFTLSYMVNEKMIVIHSECFVLEIYGFHIEDTLYFDFYTDNKKYYTNADRLFSIAGDQNEIAKILRKHQHIHTTPVTTLIHPNNLDNTLKAEAWLFTYIEGMTLFTKDFLACHSDNYKDFLSPAM